MSATEEVTGLKKSVEDLKAERIRLAERLQSLREEKDRLLAEAVELGLDDPRNLERWITGKRAAFERAKAEIQSMIDAAQGTDNA